MLCLHQWGAHGHPFLMSPDEASPGNGLLLFFRVDDFGLALKRARALVTRFEEEPHVNPNTQTREFSLRDPDGYYVTISALPAPQRRRACCELLIESGEAFGSFFRCARSRSNSILRPWTNQRAFGARVGCRRFWLASPSACPRGSESGLDGSGLGKRLD